MDKKNIQNKQKIHSEKDVLAKFDESNGLQERLLGSSSTSSKLDLPDWVQEGLEESKNKEEVRKQQSLEVLKKECEQKESIQQMKDTFLLSEQDNQLKKEIVEEEFEAYKSNRPENPFSDEQMYIEQKGSEVKSKVSQMRRRIDALKSRFGLEKES